jgi:acyl-CoA thioesterase FadM
MPPLVTRRRVEFRDTDAAGIVHFSAFFFWMESVEHELLRAAGVPVVERTASGVDASWPRVATSCDYITAIRFGQHQRHLRLRFFPRGHAGGSGPDRRGPLPDASRP